MNKKKSSTKMTQVRRPRNPVAQSPLLRKGGPHEKSKSSKRFDLNKKMKEQIPSTY